jgi:hypothetical protein
MASWRPVLAPVVLSMALGALIGLLGLVAISGGLGPTARGAASEQADDPTSAPR